MKIGYTNEGFHAIKDDWYYLPDSDSDNLPDIYEEEIGTDPFNADTDGDLLRDDYELYLTGTDPTLYDTNDNGVNDGDEDFDEDSLTNYEEYLNGTNPLYNDTDDDGISDNDELFVHLTDPLDNDTDNDDVLDGDELKLGIDPTLYDTDDDGTYDGAERFTQTHSYDVGDDECAVTEIQIDFADATNCVDRTTDVENIMGIDYLSSNIVGLVGAPFEIETTSSFTSAVLTYKVNPELLGETEFDNLMFLWYDEENGVYVELETVTEEESMTVSTTVTHFSQYMVVDKYKWFEAWSVEFDYNPTGGGSGAPSIPVKYNTVLAIDCSGSMDWIDKIAQKENINSGYEALFPNTCNRITAAKRFIGFMHPNDEASIVLFTSNAVVAAPMTSSQETLKLALQKMRDYGGTSFSAALNASLNQIENAGKITNGANKNRIILLSDGDDNDSSIVRDAAAKACEEKYVEVYTIGFGSANDETLQDIADRTGGKYYKVMDAKEIVEIFAQIGYMDDFDMTDTDGDGLPDAVEAAGIRLQN